MTLAEKTSKTIKELLRSHEKLVIAASGGIDSLLLALLCHRNLPDKCFIAHIKSPAVPQNGTARVVKYGAQENWRLDIITSSEFEDEQYLKNPLNRCFHCKSNVYQSISDFYTEKLNHKPFRILSGNNMDDMSDYRPGLQAALNWQVLHPYVQLKISKAGIRQIARQLNLDFSELPASPCLSSRIYTGTRITEKRLEAIYDGEEYIKEKLNPAIVRCRVRDNQMIIEVNENCQKLLDQDFLKNFSNFLLSRHPHILSITINQEPYKSGRAFVRQ